MNETEKQISEKSENYDSRADRALAFGILSLLLVLFTLGIGSFIFAMLTFKCIKKTDYSLCSEGACKKMNVAKALAILGLVASFIMLGLVAIVIVIGILVLIGLVLYGIFNVVLALVSVIASVLISALGMAIGTAIEQIITGLVQGIADGFKSMAFLIM